MNLTALEWAAVFGYEACDLRRWNRLPAHAALRAKELEDVVMKVRYPERPQA